MYNIKEFPRSYHFFVLDVFFFSHSSTSLFLDPDMLGKKGCRCMSALEKGRTDDNDYLLYAVH